MDFGFGHVRNKWSDKHGRFTLSDERGGGSDNRLCARNTQSPEHKGGKLLDEPLQETNVVEDLNQGDEEDDGRNDTEKEPRDLRGFLVGEESNTFMSKAQKITSTVSNKFEDVVTNAGSQDEKADDVLRQHADDDGLPVDAAAVCAGEPEDENHDQHTKQTDSSVRTIVVGDFLGSEAAHNDDSQSSSATKRDPKFRGDHIDDDNDGAIPDPANSS